MGELDEIIDTVREGLEELSCSKIEHVKKKEPWEDEQLQNLVKGLKATKDSAEVRKRQDKIKELERSKELKIVTTLSLLKTPTLRL